MSILKWFIRINQQICNKIELLLPTAKPDITELYSKTVATYVNSMPKQVIIDVGGGRQTSFAKYLNPELKHKLIVIDSLKEELKKNIYANQIIITDIDKKLPLQPSSADLIASRYVLEHLNNLSVFVSDSQKALKNGGYFIHLFSCKFALFAVLNQLLPDNFSNILLNYLVPGSKNIRGYKTSYNKCYYDKVIKILTSNGFWIESVVISYYQSRYFSFFVPFYLISILYELFIRTLGLKNLCSYILIVAKKI